MVTAKKFALIFYFPSLFPVISSEIAISRKQKLRKTVSQNAFWQDIFPDSFGHEEICLKPNKTLMFWIITLPYVRMTLSMH